MVVVPGAVWGWVGRTAGGEVRDDWLGVSVLWAVPAEGLLGGRKSAVWPDSFELYVDPE